MNETTLSENQRDAGNEIIWTAMERGDKWQDKPDSYWLARLVQEVGELGSALVGDHDDPPEHELRQIGSIAMNWLAKRKAVEAPPPTEQQA